MNESRLSRNEILELRELGRSSNARNVAKSVLVEGSRAIAGAKNSGALFKQILLTGGHDQNIDFEDVEVFEIDEKTASKIATTSNPQGAIGICEMPVFDPNDLTSGELFEKPVLVLDNVSDPGNVGTIVRSVVAFGIGAVILVGGCDPFHPKVVRSSAGMIFGCRIASIEPFQLPSILAGREIYVAQASEENELQTIDFPNNCVVAFGNEANGFQTEFFRENTHEVSINMEELCESLNVAMTATLVAYHLSTIRNSKGQ